MKIRIIEKSYSEVMSLPKEEHKPPKRPSILFRTLMKLLSVPTLRTADFSCERIGMEALPKGTPALYLMNHSSFIDLNIVASLLYPQPFNIVATTDGFIGKKWLMHEIGCIPTEKFVRDTRLLRDIIYAAHELSDSIVLFPEAGYSFDGRATSLPESIGAFIKKLGIPVVMITTYGAYHRDPLYNNLQIRKVKVKAKMEYLYSPSQLSELSAEEIFKTVNSAFSFDNFRWQQENGIRIAEDFRADSLNRILYKCPACHGEGRMEGVGTELICRDCGKKYTLDEFGFIRAENGETEYSHIPDWYDWQRAQVKEEIMHEDYRVDMPVDIYMSVNTKGL